MKLHFGHLMGLSAIAIAGCAAFFSVYGISQLFAGASTAVIVMASALEFSKLVAASYLQRYWNKIAVGLRIYVATGVIVLIIITSAGIYGFLSNAYQKTANKLGIFDKQTEVITLKKDRYQEQLNAYAVEKTQLNQTINDLSKGLSNNVIQYKDKQSGQVITSTSSATRKALTNELNDSKSQREVLTDRMVVLNDSITKLDLDALDLAINDEATGEVGPLKYLSTLTGISMDRVVNYFILLLIFVFDPLAVALILATNWVFEQENKRYRIIKDDELYDDDDEFFAPNENLVEAKKNYDKVMEKYNKEPDKPSIDELVSLTKVMGDDAKAMVNTETQPKEEEIDTEIVEKNYTEFDNGKVYEESAIDTDEVITDESTIDIPEEIGDLPEDVFIPVSPVIAPEDTYVPQPPAVAKNLILKPVSNIGLTKEKEIDRVEFDKIKEVQEANRKFSQQIPRRRA